jgi:hypothetical protein
MYTVFSPFFDFSYFKHIEKNTKYGLIFPHIQPFLVYCFFIKNVNGTFEHYHESNNQKYSLRNIFNYETNPKKTIHFLINLQKNLDNLNSKFYDLYINNKTIIHERSIYNDIYNKDKFKLFNSSGK